MTSSKVKAVTAAKAMEEGSKIESNVNGRVGKPGGACTVTLSSKGKGNTSDIAKCSFAFFMCTVAVSSNNTHSRNDSKAATCQKKKQIIVCWLIFWTIFAFTLYASCAIGTVNRIIEAPPMSSASESLAALNWNPISHRRYAHCCILIFKTCINNLINYDFSLTFNSNIHAHNTRSKSHLHLSRVKTNWGSKNCLIKLLRILILWTWKYVTLFHHLLSLDQTRTQVIASFCLCMLVSRLTTNLRWLVVACD